MGRIVQGASCLTFVGRAWGIGFKLIVTALGILNFTQYFLCLRNLYYLSYIVNVKIYIYFM